jgi:sulfoxide reductase heme-binding subunit YedZ
MQRALRARLLRVGGLLVCAAPGVGLLAGFAADELGANPVETITHVTGEWALRLLLLALAVTPLRRALAWPELAPLRRTLGLAAFAYACLHLTTWAVLDLGLDLAGMLEDILERPFVAAGFAAFCGLLPLAITSTRGWQRRLGRRWVVLHRLVYVAAGLAILHFVWGAKADLAAPLIHGALLALLLGLRARTWLRARAGSG